MAIDIRYDAGSGILYASLSGPLDPVEIRAALRKVVSDPGIPSDADSIWDLHALDFSTADLSTIQAVVAERTAVAEARGAARSAFVVSAIDEEILVRLYHAHTQHIARETRVFRSIEQAEEWLRGEDRHNQPA